MQRFVVLLLLAVACRAQLPPDEAGSLAVALTDVPAEVGCLQLTIAGAARTFQRMYTLNVAADGSQTIHASGLPTGPVVAAANAYPLTQGGCSIIGAEVPASWVSDPATATLVPGVEAALKLVLHANGRASVTITFDGDGVLVKTLVGPSLDGPPLPDLGPGVISGGFDARAGTGGGMRAVLADSAQHALWLYDDGQGKGSGSVTQIGGTLGKPGFADGPLQGSAFDDPEGGTTALRPIWNPPNSGGFVADTGNCAVREVDLDGSGGGTVTTIGPHGCSGGPVDGPPGVASLAGPRGIETLVLGGGATQLIAISDGHAIRALVVDGKTGKLLKVTTLAGDATTPGENDDSSGLVARFNKPRGLAWDGAHTLYVADEGNHAIRALDLATGGVRTVVGQPGFPGEQDGAAGSALLEAPRGVSWDAMGSLVITQGNGAIRRLQGGVLVTLAGIAGTAGHADGAGTTATFQNLGQGFSVAGSFQCNFYVGDGARLRLVKY